MKANPHLLSIDVGSLELVTATSVANGRIQTMVFANDPIGHKKLIAHARHCAPRGSSIRVGLEATGTYSLEVALVLSRTPGFEVSVINPKTIKNFLRAQGLRGKTDKIDAAGILRFLEVMPFRPWVTPSNSALALQSIARRIYQLSAERVREHNRLHAIRAHGAAGDIVAKELLGSITALKQRMQALITSAKKLIQAEPVLQRKFDLLCSVRGIADRSAVLLLGELLVLDPQMKGPQWVAHAGLDPRVRQSGTSLDGHRYISKAGNRYIRAALYMPALVTVRREPAFQAKYAHLVEQLHKHKMVALIAIMRKLLLCIHGMIKTDTPFDPLKLQPLENPSAHVAA